MGTENQRTIYYTYHPTLNTQLTRTETSLIEGDKVTVRDYDDPSTSDDTDTPNEDPTLLMHRKIEKGHTRDINGNPVPYEYVTTFEYYPDGQLKSTGGPLAGEQDKTGDTYHATGDLHQVTRPLIGTATYDNYDDAGNPETVTDVNNVATTITYDARNRSLSETRNGIINERTYDTAGNLMTDSAGGIVTDYKYYDDPAEPFKLMRLKKIINASGDYTFYDYDDKGNRTEESVYAKNEDGTFTRKKYQRFEYYDETGASPGKLWKEVNPDDTATVYKYDEMGNIQRVTDAVNKATAYTYDQFSRTETVTQGAHSANPAVTAQAYDLHSNLKLVTDAESNETGYLYDDMGRRIKRESPDTGVTVYAYDSAGKMVAQKNADNVTVDYLYDSLNRLTHINFPDSSQNITFTYDQGDYAKGRLTGVTFPFGSQAFAYNADGRLSGVTETTDGQPHTYAYEYHASGQIELITLNSGLVVEYVINADGQIGEVKVNGTPLITDLKNLPFGPIESMSMEDEKLSFARNFTLRYQPQQILATWGIPTPEPTPTPTPTEPPFPTPTPTPRPTPTEPPFPTPTPTPTEEPLSGPTATVTQSMALSEEPVSAPTTLSVESLQNLILSPDSFITPSDEFLNVPWANSPGNSIHGPRRSITPGADPQIFQLTNPNDVLLAAAPQMMTESTPIATVNSDF